MSAMVENRPPQQQLDALTDIKDAAKTETGKLLYIDLFHTVVVENKFERLAYYIRGGGHLTHLRRS